MTKQVLFIQGGGAGAYDEDKALVASLQEALGAEYDVLYPEMRNEDDPELWKPQLSKEVAALDGAVFLVGHSAGASVLLQFLAEERVTNSIVGVFLIATPFWGAEVWQASQLPEDLPIFFYHSRDDEIVPYAHLALFAEKLPQASICEFDGRGHQFNNDLSDVAADILNLQDG